MMTIFNHWYRRKQRLQKLGPRFIPRCWGGGLRNSLHPSFDLSVSISDNCNCYIVRLKYTKLDLSHSCFMPDHTMYDIIKALPPTTGSDLFLA